MNEVILKQVIYCVKQNKPFSSLAQKHYTYGQISELVILAENENLIIYSDGKYSLTEKGNELFDKLPAFEPKKIHKKYYRTDVLSIDDLYVPKYNGGSTEEK